MGKQRILSGIKPTGDITLGNYLGAIKNWIELQTQYETFLFIANLHAITTPQDAESLREKTISLAKLYMASGLDMGSVTMFVQSHIPAHSELGWILNCYTQMGELERMTQYKDKKLDQKGRPTVGLFDYPVLMAADILLYQAHLVPVGDDQKQHLELARIIANRFNNRYEEEFLKLPNAYIPAQGARIKGLQDPTKKMSKSNENPNDAILLLDDPALIEKKIMKSVTDTVGVVQYAPESQPGISNLLNILAALHDKTIDEIVGEVGSMQYGEFKRLVAQEIIAKIEPIQAKYYQISDEEVLEILNKHAEKAAKIADETLAKVKEAAGLL
jgi:tryptophanyl-tRNA synthetase